MFRLIKSDGNGRIEKYKIYYVFGILFLFQTKKTNLRGQNWMHFVVDHILLLPLKVCYFKNLKFYVFAFFLFLFLFFVLFCFVFFCFLNVYRMIVFDQTSVFRNNTQVQATIIRIWRKGFQIPI